MIREMFKGLEYLLSMLEPHGESPAPLGMLTGHKTMWLPLQEEGLLLVWSAHPHSSMSQHSGN